MRPLLPPAWQIYVQFDSWYASKRLIKYIRRQGWHAVCALKSNRKFSGQRLDQFGTTLQHKRYTRVRVTADVRTNALVLQASARDIAEVSELIAKIDVPKSEAVNEVRIFKLENSLASEVSAILMSAITGQLSLAIKASTACCSVSEHKWPIISRPRPASRAMRAISSVAEASGSGTCSHER